MEEEIIIKAKENAKFIELIKLIGDTVKEIFTVNRTTGKITVYRDAHTAMGVNEAEFDYDYNTIISRYLENNVPPQEIVGLRHLFELETIASKLKDSETISYYYRVFRNGKTQHMRLQCIRVGSADSFNEILFTFVPEDIDVRRNQMIQSIELDELTGTYTRQSFIHHTETIISKSPNKYYDIIIVDIENFRMINNVFGYSEGDKLLQYLGKAFIATQEALLVGRYSADQFIFLMDTRSDKDYIHFEELASTICHDAPIPDIVLNCGINRKVSSTDNPVTFCDNAMLALNSIKHNINRNYAFYDDEFVAEQNKIKLIEASLDKAIANHEFCIWCQPQHDSKTGNIIGAEALVRWNHPKEGLRYPNEFISVFENNGSIYRLDEYVFRTVCNYQRTVLDMGMKALPISVNVSRLTLFKHKEVAVYKKIIKEYDIPMELVPIEVTESATADSNRIHEVVRNLKKEGFVLHMDDFGSGYSSLSSLSKLPFDTIKLDKSLIDDIGDERGEAIVRYLIDLGHLFKMQVVAEGVETLEQIEFLRNFDCDVVQGYYYNKPMVYQDYFNMLSKK